MARRPIEVFSISFLDLLSGALGAIVLLYVLVPRMPVDIKEFEDQKKLKAEMDRLGVKVADLRTAIPKDKFERLTERLKALQVASKEVEARIGQTQQALVACVDGREATREKLQSIRQQIAQAKEGTGKCREDMEALAGTLRYLVVTIQWETKGQDIDLLVAYPDGSNYLSGDDAVGDHGVTATLDNRKGPGIEVWQNLDPTPGVYEIYANLYSRDGEGTEGRIVSTNPLVKVRIYHRNGFREFKKTLTTPSFNSREQDTNDDQSRARSIETAVLVTKLNILSDGKIEFN